MIIKHYLKMNLTYLKQVKNDWKRGIELLKKAYRLLVFRLIKRKAYRLHKKYNCQVFVVKFKGKITIISKYQFKQMRQHGKFPINFTAAELKKISMYYTPKRYDKERTSGITRKI
jgi:hypothetical protein